jgi:hypothetical protein
MRYEGTVVDDADGQAHVVEELLEMTGRTRCGRAFVTPSLVLRLHFDGGEVTCPVCLPPEPADDRQLPDGTRQP